MKNVRTKNINMTKAPCNYNAEDHTYTGPDGKLWPGVTTVTANLAKGFLMPWATKMCAEAVKERREELQNPLLDKTQFDELIDECKRAAKDKSEAAKEAGTLVHDWIDAYVKAKIAGTDLPEATPGHPEAQKSCEAFIAWERQAKPTWIEADCVVGSATHEFGGRFDALAEIDGKKVLIDFKTSSQFSDDYFIQLAGYQLALEEMGEKVDTRLLLRLPKDGKDAEELYVPTPDDLDRQAFLGLRAVQRFLSYINNKNHNIKENGKVKHD